MRVNLFISFSIVLLSFGPANADVRELSRNEIRSNVQAGNSMSLPQLMRSMASRVDGEMVDVRAFEDRGKGIFYRVLIKNDEGKLVAAVVDAKTGRLMSRNSSTTTDVMAASKIKGGSSKGKSATAGANGNGNSGGNGNGNSGGNGGGNSGGNGGGNSGGNGGGNSGGNGGGNSGGGGGGNGK